MGLFGFGSKVKKNSISWKRLTNLEELKAAIEESNDKSVMLFKHSIRCSISSMALNRIESQWDFSQDEIQPYYLDLITYRNVSDEIASMLNIVHASPQMIVLKEGKPVLDASHNEIQVDLIKDIL